VSKELFDNELEKLIQNLTLIQHSQRIVKKTTDRELKVFYEQKQIRDEMKEKQGKGYEDLPESVDLFTAVNPYTGYIFPLKSKKTSIEDYIRIAHLNKNKQYQWLLVDAYEFFLIFIKRTFACAGYVDPNFWNASDFGNISISDISGKDLKWFMDKAETKKNVVQPFINHFRNKITTLSKTENKCHIDALKVKLSLIGM
jgi:hypothetical protein